jgi:hypothetical protein
LSNLRVHATAVNPLRSQDFHLFSTVRGVSIRCGIHPDQGTLFTARPKTLFHSARHKNPAQAEAEDGSKMKDRVGGSAIRGNPSGNFVPECEPRKGVSWRLTELDAKNCRDDSAGSSDTQSLVLDSIFYTKPQGFAQGANQKS